MLPASLMLTALFVETQASLRGRDSVQHDRNQIDFNPEQQDEAAAMLMEGPAGARGATPTVGEQLLVDMDPLVALAAANDAPEEADPDSPMINEYVADEWPSEEAIVNDDLEMDVGGQGERRKLQGGQCGIFADGSYFYPQAGKCYNLGGNWWNDRVTYIVGSSSTCVKIWEHSDGGRSQEYCSGSNWLKLQSLSRLASRVCCSSNSGSGGGGGGGTTSTGSTSIDAISLAVHNKYRAQVGVSGLQWSSSLASSAQSWANTLASSNSFQHSGRSGENLAKGTSSAYNVEKLTELWADERRYFISGRAFPDVSTTGNWVDVGHYTQMIWRGTTTVGCATAAGGGNTILVCHYSGSGNVIGQTPF